MSDNKKLIEELQEAVNTAKGSYYGLGDVLDSIDLMEQAIAALSAKPEPECDPAAYMFADDLEIFCKQEASAPAYSIAVGAPDKGECIPLYRHPLPATKPEPAKPMAERVRTMAAAAEHFHQPASPEDQAVYQAISDNYFGAAKPMTERVEDETLEEWFANNQHTRDGEGIDYCDPRIDVDLVRQKIRTLAAEHEAQLAEKDARIEEFRLEALKNYELAAQAEAKGRREAFRGPTEKTLHWCLEEAIERRANEMMLVEHGGRMTNAIRARVQKVDAHIEALNRMIESARAAQEVTNGRQ